MTSGYCLIMLMGAAILLPGCVSEYAARRIIAAPNGGNLEPATAWRSPRFVDEGYRVQVGPPEAHLVYGVVEPKPLPVRVTQGSASPAVTLPEAAGGATRLSLTYSDLDGGEPWHVRMILPAGDDGRLLPPPDDEPIGTVLILQGYMGRWTLDDDGYGGQYLWHLACMFADAGYRVVLPDLRGHGLSTGETIGWGRLEARDMVQLLDDLADRDLLAGQVGIVGHSYGAAVAIHTAEKDARVAAVIAIGVPKSLDTLPTSTRAYIRQEHPVQNLILRWFLTDRMLHRAVERAGALGDFDPRQQDCAAAMQRMDTPVLLIHGALDENCPVDDARDLYDARPSQTQLVIYDGEDHWSHLTRRFDDLREHSLGWFDRWLAPATPR